MVRAAGIDYIFKLARFVSGERLAPARSMHLGAAIRLAASAGCAVCNSGAAASPSADADAVCARKSGMDVSSTSAAFCAYRLSAVFGCYDARARDACH